MAGHDDSRRLILVVEDEPGRHATLTPSLESAGYDVLTVADGSTALSAVAVRQPEAVLLGVGATGSDGMETLRRIRADPANHGVPVIVLTDLATGTDEPVFAAMAAGLDAGADDFLESPFEGRDLLTTIRDALRMRRAMAEMHAAHVAAQASAGDVDLDAAEPDRPGMAGLVQRLATRLELDGAELRGAVFGALVHDIGNLGIPEAILSKPGPLTKAEWAAMRRHPEIGESICRSFPSSRRFAPIVRHHHERWDGFGYPDRLRGEAIPVGARIVGLVDAFDAMVHDRPFRSALSVEAALAEIRDEAGRQFDPGLVPIFASMIDPAAPVDLRRP
jgi:putative two-component system response regulator